MKKQLQGLMNSTTQHKKFYIRLLKNIIPISLGILFFLSCENDIEKINALTNQLKLPDQSGKDIEVAYTDSGKLKIKFFAPEMHKYSKAEEPFTEFPQGIRVYFYDKSEKLESTINAKYAIYYQEKKLWEARNDVVAKNLKKKEELYTDQMYWDENTQKIYSHDFTKIVNEDGTFYGEEGFDADQNLEKWKLIGSKGTVNVRDDNQENQ